MRAGQNEPAHGGEPAGDQRGEFLDLASHELRGPLTALRGQVQLMQRRLRNEPGRAEELADLKKMMYQIERLSNQVDVYLAATHIAEHRFQFMRAPCDIAAVVRHVTELFAAGVRDHAIRFEAEDAVLEGDWDRKRIEELTAILLANAVKYSRGGDILVSATRVTNGVRVEVSDRGVGVPAADRRRIFFPYETGSNIENRGSGLGLYVAQAIVQGHDGRMGVRARAGGGSTFWFELPTTGVATRQRRARSARSAVAPAPVGHSRRTASRKRPVANSA